MQIRTVRVSRKGQFTIPKALRERLGMQPGEKVELWVEHGNLRAKPLKPPRRS
jgi:AbrB family looped-hinge helix DNA binding protein